MRRRSLLIGTILAATCSQVVPAPPAFAQQTASSTAGQASDPASRQERPNVLVWMLDDTGFAQLGCFGGLIETPNIDRIAQSGLRYTNYHTAPICSASRAAMLSGRNSHSVHVGSHAAGARDFPGYDARIPASAGSLAENLRLGGYHTYALGKWDHLRNEEATPAGPFNQWPSGQGFERFYGFLGADNDNWNPILIQDRMPIARPDSSKYHLNNDLADQAIAMIRSGKTSGVVAPFFLYWATSTAHAPHHAPQDWIDRYKGKFDIGWDKARALILERQKAQGLVEANAQLSRRPAEIPAWETLSANERKLYARQMEVFAASISYADEQFGRILDELAAKGELDNTIVVITSDNGASAEGGPEGTFSELTMFNKGTLHATDGGTTGHGAAVSVADNMKFLDRWGGPETYPHYSTGWANAGNTPYSLWKQTAHEGGVRVPLVVAWPKGIAAHGETRGGFVHVSDIAPTILDAAGVPLAQNVNNVPQQPMEGRSFAASFARPGTFPAHRAQYFEMYGNKGLWSDGWSIVTTHRYKTWESGTGKTPDEPWELYDLVADPGQARDLAVKYPARVTAMAQSFDEQARRFNVYPISDISSGQAEAAQKAGKAFAARDGKWKYTGVSGNIPGLVAPPVLFRSYTMSANVTPSRAGVTGPIFGFGGQLGGMGLYLRDGKPVFLLVSLDGKTVELASAKSLPAGRRTKLQVHLEKGDAPLMEPADQKVTILADGKTLTSGSLRYAMPMTFGIAETFAVGIDNGSPVLKGAKPDVPFAGQVSDVVFDFMPAAAGK